MKNKKKKVPKRILEKRERNRMDKVWRDKVMEKFDWTCSICPETKRINAHHIIPREFKQLRWDSENGIALCPLHHKFGKYSAHKNPLWFFNHIKELNIKIDFEHLLKRMNENNL